MEVTPTRQVTLRLPDALYQTVKQLAQESLEKLT